MTMASGFSTASVAVPVDRARPQVVYAHVADGVIFHIGSGTLARAFAGERSTAWEARARAGYAVVILERHACPARARLREAELIHQMQPETNVHHRRGPHRQIIRGFTKQGARCACDAPDCYGVEAARREAGGA
jgi:hypothetical protein